MSDQTEMSVRIEDAHMDAAKAMRDGGDDVKTKLDLLWALRCDAELAINFSHDIPKGPKRDHLWTVVCGADRLCAEARESGVWTHPRAV